ncbi:alpha/beta fold hydrolase [Amycolatopsis sp. NPDC059090]|uniref:alpha/beta fold hydrolase n=1 Tax=unclassified Amycolatopsis TaxID=2618356 RepID=UPI00366E72CE
MNEVRINGLTIHVGEIPPSGGWPQHKGSVVLIHGFGPDSMASWHLTLAYPLAAAGMRVLLYDLRGHGRSERPARGYRFTDLLDDLDALLLHWEVDERIFLIGNSLGGALAFGYAARHPERTAGILAIESEAPAAGYFARVAKLVEEVFFAPDDGQQTEDGTRKLLNTPQVRALLAETSIRHDLLTEPPPDPARLAAVDCQVLCLYGGESPLREGAPAIRRLLPQTRTVVFAGQKHTLLIDNHEKVREHALAWLSQQLELSSGERGDSRAARRCAP